MTRDCFSSLVGAVDVQLYELVGKGTKHCTPDSVVTLQVRVIDEMSTLKLGARTQKVILYTRPSSVDCSSCTEQQVEIRFVAKNAQEIAYIQKWFSIQYDYTRYSKKSMVHLGVVIFFLSKV